MRSLDKSLVISAASIVISISAYGADLSNDTTGSEQREADLRVIAARCGTPAFERAFFRQSTAAVKAGLISKDRPPAETEKTITQLRRSAFVLVASTSDCPAQLAQLAALQKSRSALIKAARPAFEKGH
ncbi:hypothetical protein BH11PSE13_BH11PSE13_43360 [soil metagenome]